MLPSTAPSRSPAPPSLIVVPPGFAVVVILTANAARAGVGPPSMAAPTIAPTISGSRFRNGILNEDISVFAFLRENSLNQQAKHSAAPARLCCVDRAQSGRTVSQTGLSDNSRRTEKAGSV